MKINPWGLSIWTTFLLFPLIHSGLAGKDEEDLAWYQRYEWALLFSRSEFQDPIRPNFDYLALEWRHLIPLDWFTPEDFSERRWHAIVSGYAGKPVSDFGDWIVGFYAGIRYFLTDVPDQPWYLQFNFGPQFGDAYKDREQNIIGSFIEFRSELIVGKRWSPRMARPGYLFSEINVQHISNASLAERNVGVNNLGLALGFGRDF